MDVVDTWTGRGATALQQAMRLTNEAFAAQLGTAVRTVAKWSARPETVLTPELQRALDTLLYRAPDDVKARFSLLFSTAASGYGSPAPAPHLARLTSDHRAAEALAWLDRSAGWPPGAAHHALAEAILRTDLTAIQARGFGRQRIAQQEIASSLCHYYQCRADGDIRPYAGMVGDQPFFTSVLTRSKWLNLELPLGGHDHLTFTASAAHSVAPLGQISADAALQRLAEALVADLPVGGGHIYRLLGVDVDTEGAFTCTLGLSDFIAYSLTMDLLEGELIDALAAGRTTEPGTLPLRDRYLPDMPSVLALDDRLCAGGVLALTAIARSGTASRRGPRDYLLLVQERSGRVLNAARRLAVIPKAFHEPLSDHREDAQLAATLCREMEEELFGRKDVDSAYTDQRLADPMHPSRLSEPMRWLIEHSQPEHWRMECTGFGLNLVSGNFEFASLVVVEDEEWWDRFGGHVEANWESDRLHRYSTLDSDSMLGLAMDPAWSNEGLFALMQGFRRLTEIGGDRVALPAIEVGT